MSLSAKLFFDNDDSETLLSRISLTSEQIEEAKEKKNKLLELIKPKLAGSLDVQVKHWLQGSYKNHTLIRPVRKGDEFDIDVGIYILCNAEKEGLSALDVKSLNREVLEWFVTNRPEAKLENSKTSCERLSYQSSFHIDIPIYYYDSTSDVCKLAIQDDEWVDSDPKALQDWFDDTVRDLSPKSLAQLRRVIKYLKVWTAIKGKDDGVTLPSIAITVLVALYYEEADDEDDSFIQTAIKVMGYVMANKTLPNPVQEADLFGVHARIFRISFSGELAYEVNVESDNGNFMWEKIMDVGQEFKIQPYGTEALCEANTGFTWGQPSTVPTHPSTCGVAGGTWTTPAIVDGHHLSYDLSKDKWVPSAGVSSGNVGASIGGTDSIIRYNETVLNVSHADSNQDIFIGGSAGTNQGQDGTINASTYGPISIDPTVTVVIHGDSTWTIT
mgnify:CR=1 FL=1